MRLEERRIVLDPKPCDVCGGTGQAPTYKPCPTCQGTCRGPRGGRNGCRRCYGMGRVIDRENREPCRTCNATGSVSESLCDYLPPGMFAALGLPVRVIRSDRQQTWNEANLGAGCVYSCTDYGRHQKETDEAIAAEVAAHCDRQQATKFTDRAGNLCEAVGVFCSSGGYSVRAIFPGLNPAERIAHEPDPEMALRIGAAVCEAGGNGTLFASGGLFDLFHPQD